MKLREEVLNTVLGQVLNARGMSASLETIQTDGMPDVIVPSGACAASWKGNFSDVSSDAEGAGPRGT